MGHPPLNRDQHSAAAANMLFYTKNPLLSLWKEAAVLKTNMKKTGRSNWGNPQHTQQTLTAASVRT